MLKIEPTVFCASKNGLDKKDFEDAFTQPFLKDGSESVRFAIADGSTTSSFSKEWANILIHSYAKRNDFDLNNSEFIGSLVDKWEKLIGNRDMAWFAKEKRGQGAYATLLGLELDLVNKKWESIAVGDSCLFLIRDGAIRVTFPLSNFSDFGSNPYLVSSKRDGNKDLGNWIKKAHGDFLSGDMLIMATDAISAWFLKEASAGGVPWYFFHQLTDIREKEFEKDKIYANLYATGGLIPDIFYDLAFGNNKSKKNESWIVNNWIFNNWLNDKRNAGQIKNDDATVFIINIL